MADKKFPKATVRAVDSLARHLQEKHGIGGIEAPKSAPYGLAWYIAKKSGHVPKGSEHEAAVDPKKAATVDVGLDGEAANCCPGLAEHVSAYNADLIGRHANEQEAADAMAQLGETEAEGGRVAALKLFSPMRGKFIAAAEQPAEAGKHLYWKKVFVAGEYEHPQRTGEFMVVDEAEMREWKRNFDSGVMERVFTTWGHPKNGAELIANAHGYVKAMKLEGSGNDASLWALIAVDDETDRRIKDGLLASVSVGIQERNTNKGKAVGEIMQHLALTNDPYLTNLGPFVPAGQEGEYELAAEAGGGKVPVRYFERSNNVKEHLKKLSHEQLVTHHGLMEQMGDEAGMNEAESEMRARHEATYAGKPFPGAKGFAEAMGGKPQIPAKEPAIGSDHDEPAGDGTMTDPAKKFSAKEFRKMQADFQSVAETAETLRKQVAEFDRLRRADQAEMDRLRADRAEAKRSKIASKVDGWSRARFSLPLNLKVRMQAGLEALDASSVECSFADKDGKDQKLTAYELVCSVMDEITAGGLVPGGKFSADTTARPFAGNRTPAELPNGQSEDYRADLVKYCEAKGLEKPKFDVKDAKEARRIQSLYQEMMADRGETPLVGRALQAARQ